MRELWTFENSVECAAPRDLAWRYWTHIPNWTLDADVESVEIDGPFVTGAHGATRTRRGERIEWQIVAVIAGSAATIEVPIPGGGAAEFRWTFAESGAGTRIMQTLAVRGEQESELVRSMRPALEAGIPEGMRKLCQAIDAAYRSHGAETTGG